MAQTNNNTTHVFHDNNTPLEWEAGEALRNDHASLLRKAKSKKPVVRCDERDGKNR